MEARAFPRHVQNTSLSVWIAERRVMGVAALSIVADALLRSFAVVVAQASALSLAVEHARQRRVRTSPTRADRNRTVVAV
jgi:hypothetical protein